MATGTDPGELLQVTSLYNKDTREICSAADEEIGKTIVSMIERGFYCGPLPILLANL